ncbi:hypothetical protein [Hydrogenophaga sp. 5NK40-0174]|uniref:hypothetical protein n=1 Tax=Hydrogenophaga sp. 5NK40-0174 TaxID=3127649 RepID=UPI003108F346
MTHRKNLHHVKTVAEFEAGYWYASELKQFAKEIGVSGGNKLRKDQLESIVKSHIQGGVPFENSKSKGLKSQGTDTLALDQAIENYVSNKKTKSFIVSEAQKIAPDLPKKSGVWYWTNRWREEQLEKSKRITYRDLIQHFVKLSTQEGRLPQIPSARFNNFITDFLAANEGGREEARIAWEKLKTLDIPKTYTAWKSHNA